MKRTPVERFWFKVEKGDGCWEFIGARTAFGHGVAWTGERLTGAHRFSYELANGPIPRGLFVCHRCDNPPCVNPAHLFLGTAKDNVDDMHAKGRHRSRSGGPATARQVEALRFIAIHHEAHGFAPSFHEIGAAMGISSTNGVNDHLLALASKGLITREPVAARAISITTKGMELLRNSAAMPSGSEKKFSKTTEGTSREPGSTPGVVEGT